jgi:hypothetical protein
MSYGQKIRKPWSLAAGRLARCGFDLPRQQTYTTDSDFRKEIAVRLFACRFQRSAQTRHALNRCLSADLTVADQAAGFRLASKTKAAMGVEALMRLPIAATSRARKSWLANLSEVTP